jgi:hypothetical protein
MTTIALAPLAWGGRLGDRLGLMGAARASLWPTSEIRPFATVSPASALTLPFGLSEGVEACGSRSLWLLSRGYGLVIEEDVAGVEEPAP